MKHFEDLGVLRFQLDDAALRFGELACERSREIARVEAQDAFVHEEGLLLLYRTHFDFNDLVKSRADNNISSELQELKQKGTV